MRSTLSAEDTLAIHEVIARYVHINDNYRDNPEALAQLSLVFAENISWVSHDGSERLDGLEAVLARYALEAKTQKEAQNPYWVDHHVTSTVITSVADGQVRTRSHYLAVRSDQGVSSGDYLHVLALTDEGWRIVQRQNIHRLPLLKSPSRAGAYDGWEIA